MPPCPAARVSSAAEPSRSVPTSVNLIYIFIYIYICHVLSRSVPNPIPPYLFSHHVPHPSHARRSPQPPSKARKKASVREVIRVGSGLEPGRPPPGSEHPSHPSHSTLGRVIRVLRFRVPLRGHPSPELTSESDV